LPSQIFVFGWPDYPIGRVPGVISLRLILCLPLWICLLAFAFCSRSVCPGRYNFGPVIRFPCPVFNLCRRVSLLVFCSGDFWFCSVSSVVSACLSWSRHRGRHRSVRPIPARHFLSVRASTEPRSLQWTVAHSLARSRDSCGEMLGAVVVLVPGVSSSSLLLPVQDATQSSA
jgi:hypothetical protein